MVPERTAAAYGPGVTGASKAVLLELMAVLRTYRDALVLVGGWAPYFLLERSGASRGSFAPYHEGSAPRGGEAEMSTLKGSNAELRPSRRGTGFVHVGSIDIDLAVDPALVDEPAYATIVELLTERRYRPASNRRGEPNPSSFERTVSSPVTGKPYTIRVDFLTRLDEARLGRQRHQRQVQDGLFARKVKGCEAAFAHRTVVEIAGALPDGGEMVLPLSVADVVGCLTMKGIVLGERYREKDAYDIYALIAHAGSGPRDIAAAVRPHLEDPLVRDGMDGIRRAFATRQANGPAWVGAFLINPVFAGAYQRLVTDAFMVVQEFSAALVDVPPAS